MKTSYREVVFLEVIPEGLLNAIFFYNGSLRGGEEHRGLKPLQLIATSTSNKILF